MKRKKFMLVILAITLVLGMTFVGCNDEPDDDSALNGTWTGVVLLEVGEDVIEIFGEYIFDNGNFEVREYDSSDIIPVSKGTYTTSSNKLTMTYTHEYGKSGWISLDDEEYTEIFTYNISGNTLTISYEGEEALVLTKK